MVTGNPATALGGEADAAPESLGLDESTPHDFLLAFFGPRLRYLDYRVVDAKQSAAARQRLGPAVEELEASEAVERAKREQASLEAQTRRSLRKVYALEAVSLFHEMLDQCPQLSRMLAGRMDGVPELLDDLKQRLASAADTLRTALTGRCSLLGTEEHKLGQELAALRLDAQQRMIDLLEAARRAAKRFQKKWGCRGRLDGGGGHGDDEEGMDWARDGDEEDGDCMDPDEAAAAEERRRERKSLEEHLEAARDAIESVENHLETRAARLLETFASEYREQVGVLEDLVTDFFREAIAAEAAFHEDLRALAATTVAKYSSELPQQASPQGSEADSSAPSAVEGDVGVIDEGDTRSAGGEGSVGEGVENGGGGGRPRRGRRRSSAIHSALAVDTSREDAEYLMLISNPEAMMEVSNKLFPPPVSNSRELEPVMMEGPCEFGAGPASMARGVTRVPKLSGRHAKPVDARRSPSIRCPFGPQHLVTHCLLRCMPRHAVHRPCCSGRERDARHARIPHPHFRTKRTKGHP